MSILFQKPKVKDGIEKKTFECTRDGLTIRGTEYLPQGDNLPIAVVCHPFMACQDTVRHYAVLLAEMGYASYCFDFCGGSAVNGKSDGKTTDMSVLTQVRDLEAVIDHLRNLKNLDKENILLMGCSQGGFVSALVAAKNKYPIKKLVLFYPALCIPDDARAGKMMMSRFDPQNIPETLYCGPMKLGRCYPADVMDMNAFEEIRHYNGRVLITHGTKDKIVDLSYAQRAFEAYNANSADRVSLEIIDGAGHLFSKKHDKKAFEILKRFAAV